MHYFGTEEERKAFGHRIAAMSKGLEEIKAQMAKRRAEIDAELVESAEKFSRKQ